MDEFEARLYVAKLKAFYLDAAIYFMMNIILFFVWLLSNGWYFWPFWVFLGWGMALAIRALSLKVFPHLDKFYEKLPFLNEDWEAQQLKQCRENQDHKS